MILQTILIPKASFSLKEARIWIRTNGYKEEYYKKAVDITPNYYRFRQASPNPKNITIKNYYTKKLSNGVELVFYSM